MSSQAFATSLIPGITPPSHGADQRARDVTPSMKRPFGTFQDMADTMMSAVQQPHFRGDGGALGPMKNAMDPGLAAGMTITNAGFSTSDAQGDQVIARGVIAKGYVEGWDAGFCQNMPVFCNAKEPASRAPGIHTIADLPTLNYFMELGHLERSSAILGGRQGLKNQMTLLTRKYKNMVPHTPSEFKEMWNYLGPITEVKDSSINSNGYDAPNTMNASKLLEFSLYNKAFMFNLFGSSLHKGSHLYFVCKDVDMSHMRNFVDPTGNAVVARTQFEDRIMQVVGFSDREAMFPMHDSSYDPVSGPDSFKDPNDGDLDFIRRAHRIEQDYSVVEVDEFDNLTVRHGDPDLQNALAQTPQIIYDAYMEGAIPARVGIARSFLGAFPTAAQIKTAHRNQLQMKLLQTVQIYHKM